MDELEDFIKNNRQAFDDKEVPAGAWKNIEHSMRFRNQNLWNSVGLWRAAAVVFMIATAALLVGGQRKSLSVKSEKAIAATEFRDVEEFYVKQISEKVELIDKLQQSEGLNGFTQDFQQLEAMYTVLKEEMKSRPSEKVKDALILNLLVRIDLLNQRLHKLDKENKTEKKSKHDEGGSDRSV
ncbi:MAG: hypothetical protein ABJA70_13930 [Chryseolinea sp.]